MMRICEFTLDKFKVAGTCISTNFPKKQQFNFIVINSFSSQRIKKLKKQSA